MNASSNPYASPTSEADHVNTPNCLASAWQLRVVYVGLSLIYGSLLLLLLGAVLLFVGRTIYPTSILPIAALLFLTFAGMWVFGHLLCLPTPAARGARWWNVACIALQWGTGPVLLLFSDPQLRSVFQGAMGIVLLVAFVLFLRQLALALNQPRLASQASATLMAGIALLVATGSCFIVRSTGVRLFPAVVAIAVLIASMVLAGALAKIVRGLRRATWQGYQAQKCRNSTAAD